MKRDEVRWLDESEAAAWVPLVSAAMWLPTALDIQLVRDAGLSHFEYGVLSGLSMQADRSLRLRDLAKSANSTFSRLSKVIDRLSDQGWVERRPDPQDGRSTQAVLTEAGWDKVVATAPGHVNRVRELIFDRLTRAEIKQLGAIAVKISAAVGPDGASSEKLI
ncbi:MarR family transcriptional regulator (plasmid) [Rhodococcus erythropolis R138]|uniref:MarR family winged helix-turn-helix transcriptional regulator n=1 Tax=Rhodococcus erythropolis TaxID=1833 RepID=UPI00049299D2|nr:MarR family transcriptional regulator [Rhodococcus erythropolis]ALU73413.1 MarR family transcriptional regulator [Rhodococcus erythropolis R138]